ncbi:MAG TPA: hypothetical protein VG605_17370 [Puia sp.]|nr:hypothetical protein [Puia sp.]
MNVLKRIFGIVWIVLGPLALFYLIRIGASDLARNPGADTMIQWAIFAVVFIPIAVGLVIFGYYCLKGAY